MSSVRKKSLSSGTPQKDKGKDESTSKTKTVDPPTPMEVNNKSSSDRGEKRKREKQDKKDNDPSVAESQVKKAKVVETTDKPKEESEEEKALAAYLAEKEYGDEDLSQLVFNLVVPMYSLLYSLKDHFEEVTGLEWSGKITEPEELKKMTAQVTPRKKSKPKDGITKPRSAYQFFCNDIRGKLESLPFGELAKEMGRQWKALSEKDRERYQEMADKDKDRYYEEGGVAGTPSSTPRKARAGTTTSAYKRASGASTISEDEGNIIIRSRRAGPDAIKQFKSMENVHCVDISPQSLDRPEFCLGYPHGMVPIPYDKEKWSMSVEGVYEGLKMFEKAGVDRSVMANVSMKALQRTPKKFGPLLGWSKGINGSKDELLTAEQARRKILYPTYKHVLEHHLSNHVADLKKILSKGKKLVIMDTNTNIDLEDFEHPLSPAILLKLYLEGKYPK